MSELLLKLIDPQFMAALLAAVAAGATVLTLALPLVEGDTLGRRMKAVGEEREKIRQRERERLVERKVVLRQTPKAYMKAVVERFKLGDWLGTETAKSKLVMAGYRGSGAEVTFLFFRLVSPLACALAGGAYLFLVKDFGLSVTMRLACVLGCTYLGIKVPELFLKNVTDKRQLSIRRAWPDSLDLLLICVEAGMSIEQAFRRVGEEVGAQSVALAEELTLTTAELSYLPERRVAYENLAKRTGLEPVKSITTALIQAERYGTPLGTALRVLAQESRDTRMMEAEKKAAGLPPKLTVPMILFFLPVLFVVIMTPAIIQIMALK
ncbi:type II secretion system F family protein [Enterovirga sp.]|uniref:type II secretion system F family protein n=1 Tax=Enterovirga sp. TaxID=2026350 RepID=UPI002C8BDED4|nr:type II secretion system F family protein [Enterovirga sp.]HMO28080.1 type II secretion system F family protein [Enterovirga sp.]